MANRFIRNQRVLDVGHHGDFLQMAGGLCNRFWVFEGCYIALNPVLIRDIVGADKFAHGLEMSFFVMSFTRSAGPPIVGWIYDSFQSYYAAFLYTGFVFKLGNCVAFVTPLLLKTSRRTEQGDESRARLQLIVDRETDV